MKKRILFVIGTRPEAIKCAPLIHEFKNSDDYQTTVCVTSQHEQLLHNVLNVFKITPDYDLEIMTNNQTLTDITSRIINGLQPVLSELKPDLVIVQGDTTTTFSAALAAFYNRVPIAHIEAGLRTNQSTPYPEEMNRKLVSELATFHFAPTQSAKDALVNEGITENVHLVGNTVIDALQSGLKMIDEAPNLVSHLNINPAKDNILVTCHRRENHGQPLVNICEAMNQITAKHPSVAITFPVHLNPNVVDVVYQQLDRNPNIHLKKPVSYLEMIWLMKQSTVIITDSGGIQEEATSLGVPTLVLREATERTEGVLNKNSKIVGTDTNTIIDTINDLLTKKQSLSDMAVERNLYGDGTASKQIRSIIDQALN